MAVLGTNIIGSFLFRVLKIFRFMFFRLGFNDIIWYMTCKCSCVQTFIVQLCYVLFMENFQRRQTVSQIFLDFFSSGTTTVFWSWYKNSLIAQIWDDFLPGVLVENLSSHNIFWADSEGPVNFNLTALFLPPGDTYCKTSLPTSLSLSDGMILVSELSGTFLLKVHWWRFKNLSICSCLYRNNTLKISHS